MIFYLKIKKYIFLIILILFVSTYSVNAKTTYYELSDDKDFLYIENIKDLSFLEKFPLLKEVHIYNSNISDTTYLENTNITSLIFEKCTFLNSEIHLPKDLKNLEFNESNLNKLNILNSKENIDILSFKNCEFNTLESLSNIKKLKNLSFDSCNIGDIKGIGNLINLEELIFIDTGIEEISVLKNLKELKSLTLNHTYIKDLTPIKDLNLLFLDVSNSINIENLNVITKMQNLSTLIAINCEMSYTEEIIKYIKNNNINTNVTNEGLNIKKQIENIISTITNNYMDDNQKIKAIVNFVIDNLEYDYEIYENENLKNEYSQNALKYALKGKGHCKNYTAITSALLRSAKINVYEQQNYNHIWNIVETNGNFYYLDTTFIDEENITNLNESKNFMTTNNNFFIEHESILIPSSLYNKIHNLQYNNSNLNMSKKIDTSKKTSSYIKVHKVIIPTIIILLSLNLVFTINKTKYKY